MSERVKDPFNHTAFYDKNNLSVTETYVKTLFAKRSPQDQAELAYKFINSHFRDSDKFITKPKDVLTWITDDKARDQVKIWCIGKGVSFEDRAKSSDQSQAHDARRLLADQSDLIKTLSPYLSPLNLARILAIKKYREADEDTLRTLVSGVYQLLDATLGPRRFYKGDSPQSKLLPLPDLPIEIYSDEVITNVLLSSEREAIMPVFNRNKEEAFKLLEQRKATAGHPLITQFVTQLEEYFKQVENFKIEGFKEFIPGGQKDVEESQRTEEYAFPTTHQKEFAYRFVNKNIGPIDLLIGDTATMKTSGSMLAMEAASAKSTIIVCPAGLRQHWEEEIKSIYADEVEIDRIETLAQFNRSLKDKSRKPHYTILSYSLLSLLQDSQADKQIQEFIANNKDSLIVDEGHLANNWGAECTRRIYLISRYLPKKAPRIVMTATGIVNSVSDLDSPVRILLPFDYPNPGDFTVAARNEPNLVSSLLHGKEILTRWTAENYFQGQLPKVEESEVAIPLSPFQQLIYDFVYNDDTIDSKFKRGMLRQTALDPMLILKYYHPSKISQLINKYNESIKQGRKSDRELELDEKRVEALQERLKKVISLSDPQKALRDLEEAYEKFLHWKAMNDDNVKFNEDFLARLGYTQLVLWSFFNIENGLTNLVAKSNQKLLKQDWEGLDGLVSSKYRRLKEDLDKLLSKGDSKIIIFSSFYQTNVATGIEDIKEDEELIFLSLFDHLRSWYGSDSILKIDGSVTVEAKAGEVSDREKVRKSWRLNPNKKILLATIRASRLGIDLTIPPIKANENINQMWMIFLDPPDTNADKVQSIGRGKRKVQKIPINVSYYLSANLQEPDNPSYGFIDHDIWEGVNFKRLLSQWVLDGIVLSEDDQKFVLSHMKNVRQDNGFYPVTPQSYLVNEFFRNIRGKSMKELRDYLNQPGFEGMSNLDFFTSFYPKYDSIGPSAHNAKAVAEIIRKVKQISGRERLLIASDGAGAGILQTNLGEPVHNIDMLEEILLVGRGRERVKGQYITANGTSLPFRSGAFDVLDLSYTIHWTHNSPILRIKDPIYYGEIISDRSAFLYELSRVTKPTGFATISLPFSHLTSEKFKSWQEAFSEYFGFRLHSQISSGFLRALDYKTENISWIFNLEKFKEPDLELIYKDSDKLRQLLSFEFEDLVKIKGVQNHRNSPLSVNGQNGDFVLPHNEFELIDPSTGKSEKLVYNTPDIDFEDLLAETEPNLTESNIFTKLEQEKYGIYRRLVKESMKKFNISYNQAKQISLQAIEYWQKNGDTNRKGSKTWSELLGYLELIQNGENTWL